MANVLEAGRIVLGFKKHGALLNYKGYLFSRNRLRANRIYWRCIDKSCALFMHTTLVQLAQGSTIRPADILKEPSTHRHPPCDASIQHRDMLKSMIDIVKADPCAPVSFAYDNVTSGPSSTDILDEAVPTFASVASIHRRRRSECFPPVPTTIADVDIRGEWAVTWLDKQHLTLLDNNWGMVVFMTVANTRLLRTCDTIFIDGTFRTAPHPFYQLVTIHALYRGVVIPVCFALLSGKSIGHYRLLLSHVSTRVRRVTNRVWNPQNVICDFELGLITALQTEIPGCRVRGCYFHYTQSLWKKVASLGLVTAYRGTSRRGRKFRKIIQKIMAIGFLPSLLISRAFQILWRFQNQGFPSTSCVGLTTPALTCWCDMRTNNSVESYHSRWNKIVSVKRPSLWHFIKRLKDEEARIRRTIRQVRTELLQPTRRSKWRRLDDRIQVLKDQYNQGLISMTAYWDSIRYAVRSN